MPRDGSFYDESMPGRREEEFLPKEPILEPDLPPGVGLPPPQEIIQFCEYAVFDLYSSVKKNLPLDLAKVSEAAQKICQNMQAIFISPSISELSRISDNVLYVSLLEEPLRSSMVAHSVKVATLGVFLGQQLHLGSSELHELACSGLVHNLGMLTIPSSLLNKKEQLTADEQIIVREHSRLGHDILSQLGEPHQYLPRLVHQIHERENGSGYPSGLSRGEIDVRAKILGLADVYTALIQSRPHRPAFKPFEALNQIISFMEGQFEQSLLNIFIRTLSVYPVGSYVELSSGETARVLVSNPSYPMRPLVEVITDEHGIKLPSPRYLDLVENPVFYIKRISPTDPRRDQ